jgi:hypothetical protein
VLRCCCSGFWRRVDLSVDVSASEKYTVSIFRAEDRDTRVLLLRITDKCSSENVDMGGAVHRDYRVLQACSNQLHRSACVNSSSI